MNQVHQLLRLIAVPCHFTLFIPKGQLKDTWGVGSGGVGTLDKHFSFKKKRQNQTVVTDKTDFNINFTNPLTGPLLQQTHGWTALQYAQKFNLNSIHDPQVCQTCQTGKCA